MQALYSTVIYIYGAFLYLAALFNPKASKWVKGRKKYFTHLDAALNNYTENTNLTHTAWFHCASLGEFEQGRPIMESFRLKHPEYKIIVSFFSPSGYEVRKNYTGAHIITYLPLDTPRNARLFIEKVKPDIVFYIKYEFWFNMLTYLQQQKIPTLLVSAIFRPEQHFFAWYGAWSRKLLSGFTHLFVQNEASVRLLSSVGINNVSISGDTRFDRVAQIAQSPFENKIAETFSHKKITMVAGSTWPADEALIIAMMDEISDRIRLIIAPHEIHEAHLSSLMQAFKGKAVRYSQTNETEVNDASILIIDSIGMLSHLFRFGALAYIGGGFGVSIHNILEPATFGLPIFFGPKMQKFKEAHDLVKLNSAFIVTNEKELTEKVKLLLDDAEQLELASVQSKNYVIQNTGATSMVIEFAENLVTEHSDFNKVYSAS